MRVLYDTNVLVKILCSRQSILAFREIITREGIVNISSQHILQEVETVLAEKMKLTKQKAKAATRLLARQSTIVNPKTIEKVARDPFDDYILASALLGKAEYIVTADQDLLILKQYKGIKIVTPDTFRKVVGMN